MIACTTFWSYLTPIVAGIAIAYLLLQNRRLTLRAYCAEQAMDPQDYDNIKRSQGVD